MELLTIPMFLTALQLPQAVLVYWSTTSAVALSQARALNLAWQSKEQQRYGPHHDVGVTCFLSEIRETRSPCLLFIIPKCLQGKLLQLESVRAAIGVTNPPLKRVKSQEQHGTGKADESLSPGKVHADIQAMGGSIDALFLKVLLVQSHPYKASFYKPQAMCKQIKHV